MNKWSPSTRGFYALQSSFIPADAVEITDQQKIDLLAAELAGLEIMPDVNGFPVAQAKSVSLQDLKSVQIKKISQDCQDSIIAGQLSSALGAEHLYPTAPIDQQNLTANFSSSLVPGLSSNWSTPQMCRDSDGVWAYRLHSAAQIQQVGIDVKAAIVAILLHKYALQSQINAATTIEAVKAVVW